MIGDMTRWTDLDGAIGYAGNVLQGERVRLRAPHEDDFPTLAEWWCDPVVAILNNSAIMPESRADAVEALETIRTGEGELPAC
jgi:RimJ/RimL family protein N-acetyltransferase